MKKTGREYYVEDANGRRRYFTNKKKARVAFNKIPKTQSRAWGVINYNEMEEYAYKAIVVSNRPKPAPCRSEGNGLP